MKILTDLSKKTAVLREKYTDKLRHSLAAEKKAPPADDYKRLKQKMYLRLIGSVTVAFVIIVAFYLLFWFRRGGNMMLEIFQVLFRMDFWEAMELYNRLMRNNEDVIWSGAVAIVFLLLVRFFINGFARYFNFINRGIDALLDEEAGEIHLPPEMAVTERKLNTVKQTLKERELEVKLAEQRKNELVMYLAHDIRTPLTSVIGYLSLLSEASDMPAGQKEKYVNITLEKAYRLEKMVNEFFDITRYNRQQIHMIRETIDLYYMLVQLSDELSPMLLDNGNRVTLHADENLTLYGDPDQLARVFSNVLKNAAAYSAPNTEIIITAAEAAGWVTISFQNEGKTIPQERLAAIFDKFYRLDEARASNTGGTGLGLAIAWEIVGLHGGKITAASENDTVTFEITLPIGGSVAM